MRDLLRNPLALLVGFFLLGTAFGTSLSVATITSDAIAAASFCILSIAMVYPFLFLKQYSRENRWLWAATGIAAPVGILSATAALGTTETFFWVYDSTTAHVPMAKSIMEMVIDMTPPQNWSITKSMGTGGITHLFVGIWFALFGASAVVSSLAMTTLKFGTILILSYIGSALFVDFFKNQAFGGARTAGFMAFVPYAIVPTVTFHTLALYKEAMVHLLVAIVLLATFKAKKNMSWQWTSVFGIAVCGLVIERSYVAVLLSPLIFIPIATTDRSRRTRSLVLIGMSIAAIGLWAPLPDLTWSKLLATLNELRFRYSNYPGISVQFNYEISYPVAVLKTTFTPIWAPNKLEMFRGASALFTWGSFIHQLVMLLYLVGVYRLVRAKLWAHVLLQLPFVIFLLIAAYVAPWSARTRDSFYPLISVYAFLGLDWIIELMMTIRRAEKVTPKALSPNTH